MIIIVTILIIIMKEIIVEQNFNISQGSCWEMLSCPLCVCGFFLLQIHC